MQYSFLVLNIIFMVQVWGDLEDTSEGSYVLITEAILCLKTTTFLMHKNRWIRLLSFLESDIFTAQTLEHKKILSRQALKMWRVYVFLLTCGTAQCIQWALAPLLDDRELRVYPFKIWMPIDPANCPAFDYYIGYTYQMIAIFISATSYLTIDYVTGIMIMYAAAQLEIIAEKIKQIPPVRLTTNPKPEEEKTLKDNNEILNECIQHHQAVMRFVEKVENIFNVTIFFQMSCTVAVICIIGIHITSKSTSSVQFYSSVNYLVTMLSQLYLYCWCGNEVTDKSQVLRDTLYTSSWCEQDQRFRKTLLTAMECMKRPILFRAGYYIPLSRPTFVSILRCSYSYFAVLNQAQANNK